MLGVYEIIKIKSLIKKIINSYSTYNQKPQHDIYLFRQNLWSPIDNWNIRQVFFLYLENKNWHMSYKQLKNFKLSYTEVTSGESSSL